MSLRSVRMLLCGSLASVLGACTVWRPVAAPTPSDTPTYVVSQARLVRTQGDTITLRSMTFTRDSVLGTGIDSLEHRLARHDIAKIETFDVSTGATVVLSVALGVAGFFGFIYWAVRQWTN